MYINISSWTFYRDYLTSSNANIHTLISLFQISSAGKACMRDRNNLGPHLHVPILFAMFIARDTYNDGYSRVDTRSPQ